jgi:hypothetical protein
MIRVEIKAYKKKALRLLTSFASKFIDKSSENHRKK